MKHTLNADFEGDTPHGLSYPIATLPIVKQRQILICKRMLKKRARRIFNNKSLKRKNDIRKLSRTIVDKILLPKKK